MVSRIAIVLAALMVVGGMAHGATYTKVADADGTIGTSFGTAYSWINTWGDNDIRVGYGDYQTRRALMKFNINWAAVPTTITAATLNIDTWTVNTGYENLKLALVTEDFTGTSGNTDYFLKTSSTMWATAGGSPETSTELSVTLTGSSSMDIDVLSLINKWKANQSSYFGLLLYDPTQATDNNYSRVYATESPDPPATDAHRDPTLVIVPEPVSLSLLVLGGVGVLLRRRR